LNIQKHNHANSNQRLKDSFSQTDISPIGDIVQFPVFRDISPDVYDLIKDRTKRAAYWVQRWSEINKNLFEADPEHMDMSLVQEASHYVHEWLCDCSSIAIKLRGF
jgi:hypothetical protein